MAVERTGTAVTIGTSSATSSQSVDVPSDCDCVVLFHVGANDGSDPMFGSSGAIFTLGGQSLTWRTRTPASANNIDESAHTLVNPPTGSQTFAWTGCSETYGIALILVFYKGVDTSDPVLASSGNSTDIGSVSVTSLATATGSKTVAAVGAFSVAPDASGNSQTVFINNSGPYYATELFVDVAEKAESSSMSATTGDYMGIVAVSLRAMSATITLNQHSFRFFNDDGSESGSTVKAALNTNVNLSANDVARVRFLVDSTGDAPAKSFTLEYRKKPSGGSFGPWLEVE